jgi:predicted DNA-binding transcriptional regulator AlpA
MSQRSQMSTGGDRDEGTVVRQTYTLGEVSKLLGIGRNQAYEGARRGDFPTIRIGKRLVAPKAAINKMLGLA